MKIKILKTGNHLYWYAQYVGEEIEVKKIDSNGQAVVTPEERARLEQLPPEKKIGVSLVVPGDFKVVQEFQPVHCTTESEGINVNMNNYQASIRPMRIRIFDNINDRSSWYNKLSGKEFDTNWIDEKGAYLINADPINAGGYVDHGDFMIVEFKENPTVFNPMSEETGQKFLNMFKDNREKYEEIARKEMHTSMSGRPVVHDYYKYVGARVTSIISLANTGIRDQKKINAIHQYWDLVKVEINSKLMSVNKNLIPMDSAGEEMIFNTKKRIVQDEVKLLLDLVEKMMAKDVQERANEAYKVASYDIDSIFKCDMVGLKPASHRGEWEFGDYYPGDTVNFEGHTYKMTSEYALHSSFPPTTLEVLSFWKLVNPIDYCYRGGVRVLTDYIKGDIVKYLGYYYYCKVTDTNFIDKVDFITRSYHWFLLPDQNFEPAEDKKFIVEIPRFKNDYLKFLRKKQVSLTRLVGRFSAAGRKTPQALKIELNAIEVQLIGLNPPKVQIFANEIAKPHATNA